MVEEYQSEVVESVQIADNAAGIFIKHLEKKKDYESRSTKKSTGGVISPNQDRLHFGLLRLLCLFIGLTIGSNICEIIYFWNIYPNISRVSNMVLTYINECETWSAFFILGTSMWETILWNNTVQMWDRSSLELFEDHAIYIKSSILPNITHYTSLDLGNYTDLYKITVDQVNPIK